MLFKQHENMGKTPKEFSECCYLAVLVQKARLTQFEFLNLCIK